MRSSRGSAALAVLFSSATLATCVFPTERDDAVHVSVSALPILLQGDRTDATARAWQMRAAGDSQQISNITFVWSSDAPAIADVDGNGHVVGIKSGTTTIRAAARNFDKRALVGQASLRVSAPLEIDSIRPQTVQYGETVTIYGVGVDSLFQVTLGQGVLIPYFFSNTRNAAGYARNSFWVPPPAHTDSTFFIGNGVFGFSKDTVRVIRRDRYEPNESAPTPIDLETSRPFPGTLLNVLLFFNPALSFEPLPRDVKQGADWYRLQHSATRDLTIALTAPEVKGTFQVFLSDSLGVNATGYFIGSRAWTFGPKSHACRGKAFSPSEATGDAMVVALAGMPAGSLDAVAIYGQTGRYSLAVVDGYFTSDSADKRIVKDAHEEDDFCDAAGASVAVSLPYQATLTIDNPHDVDWIKFNLPSAAPVRIRTMALPAVAGRDTSDIDAYLLREPSPGAPLDSISGYAHPGSTSDTTFGLLGLPAGTYYAVVVDFAGVPTPYTICIGDCLTFPAAPVLSATQRQSAVDRRAVLQAGRARSRVTAPASPRATRRIP